MKISKTLKHYAPCCGWMLWEASVCVCVFGGKSKGENWGGIKVFWCIDILLHIINMK